MIIPCPNKPCCPPGDNPLTGMSSETLDKHIYIGLAWGTMLKPPSNDCATYPCFDICESTDSQELADQCAQRLVQVCDNGINTFFNSDQSCQSECPDGSIYFFTVAAGTFASRSQLLADRLAFTSACKKAKQFRICLSALSIVEGCADVPFSALLICTSSSSQITFDVFDGALPWGLTLKQVAADMATISGTPTVTGTFNFTIEAKDTHGGSVRRACSINIVGITSNSPLPDATNGTPYSFTLTPGGTSDTLFWSISAGALPTGLSLNASTGEISGTPTVNETASFTVTMSTNTLNCIRHFQMTVKSAGGCVAPPFLPEYLSGVDSGTFPFNGTAGEVLNAFADSFTMNCHIQVFDPSMVLIADGTFSPYGNPNLVQVALASNGVYTVNVTADLGAGNFTLDLASGQIAAVNINGLDDYYLAYATTSELIFVADRLGLSIDVVDPITNTVISTTTLSDPTAGQIWGMKYGSVQDKIYVLYSIPATSEFKIQELNPATGAEVGAPYIVYTRISGSVNDGYLDYDNVNDRLVVSVSGGFDNANPNYSVVDCVTKTVINSGQIPGADVNRPACVTSQNQYWFSQNTPGKLLIMDANTFVVTDPAVNAGYNLNYVEALDLVVVNMPAPI